MTDQLYDVVVYNKATRIIDAVIGVGTDKADAEYHLGMALSYISDHEGADIVEHGKYPGRSTIDESDISE